MQHTSPTLDDTVMYAGFGRRFCAWAIDFIATAIMMAVIRIIGSLIPGGFLIPLLGGLVIGVAYGAGFESSRYQSTPGKMLLGLKVTDIDGQRLNLDRAIARNWAMSVSNLTLGIGYLMIFKSKKHQGLHDKIANCLVVRAPKVLGCGEHHTPKIPRCG